MNASSWPWLREHKWRLLLTGSVPLLLISPISGVYDRQDNVISPLTAGIFLAVILGTSERRGTLIVLSLLILIWMTISVVTPGSGLFSGSSLLAPILFMVVLVALFVLLVRWMARTTNVNAEVLCAAVCGYLLLGLFWAGLYAAVEKIRLLLHEPDGFWSAAGTNFTISDWLYFSYTTLTTTGYGDILPRSGEVRMLAVIEAMVGLFYNTIVISRLVSLYGLRVNEISPPK